MNPLGLVLALVAVAVAIPVEQRLITTIKDLPDSATSRIIDGEPAEAGQIPWQVAVRGFTPKKGFFCGGSLISNQWVLTAGHCVKGAVRFELYLGSVLQGASSEPGRVIVNTDRAIAHPGYNPVYLHNDIALISLPEPVTFTDRIQPIVLRKPNQFVDTNVTVRASGWGKTSAISSVSKVLNFVNLRTISNKECANVYTESVVIESTLCAVGAPHHSTCNGDSGGPLVVFDSDGKATLAGVVSFVHKHGCASGNPSGYVRPEKHIDWINEVTGLDL